MPDTLHEDLSAFMTNIPDKACRQNQNVQV